MEAKILDINKKTLMDVRCTKTDDYITKVHIMPIAVSNEISSCYPKGIFDLIEASGYTIIKLDEVQKYNPFNGSSYTAFTFPLASVAK